MKIRVILPVILTWVLYIGACFGVFYYIKGTLDKKHEQEKPTEVIVSTEESLQEEGTTEEEIIKGNTDNPLVPVETGEVKILIDKMLKAMADGDIKQLKTLDLYKEAYSDESTIQKASDIVEDYKNVKIYSKKGIDDNSFVIFVLADMKVRGCETLAPGMFRFYVVRDEKDNWHVNTAPVEELDSAVFAHMHGVQNDEDVLQLIKKVNKAFAEACKKDQTLKNLVDHN